MLQQQVEEATGRTTDTAGTTPLLSVEPASHQTADSRGRIGHEKHLTKARWKVWGGFLLKQASLAWMVYETGRFFTLHRMEDLLSVVPALGAVLYGTGVQRQARDVLAGRVARPYYHLLGSSWVAVMLGQHLSMLHRRGDWPFFWGALFLCALMLFSAMITEIRGMPHQQPQQKQ